MPNFSVRGQVPGSSALPIANIFGILCNTRESTEALLGEVALMRADNAEIKDTQLQVVDLLTQIVQELRDSRTELAAARSDMQSESEQLRVTMDETRRSLDVNSDELSRGFQARP